MIELCTNPFFQLILFAERSSWLFDNEIYLLLFSILCVSWFIGATEQSDIYCQGKFWPWVLQESLLKQTQFIRLHFYLSISGFFDDKFWSGILKLEMPKKIENGKKSFIFKPGLDFETFFLIGLTFCFCVSLFGNQVIPWFYSVAMRVSQ